MSSQPSVPCSRGLDENVLNHDDSVSDESSSDHEKSTDEILGIEESYDDDNEAEEKPTPRTNAFNLMMSARQGDKNRQGKKRKLNLRADDHDTKMTKFLTAPHKKMKSSQESREEHISTHEGIDQSSAEPLFMAEEVAQLEECPVEQSCISNHLPPMQAISMIPSQICSLHDEATLKTFKSLTGEVRTRLECSPSVETLIKKAMSIAARKDGSYKASLHFMRTLLFEFQGIHKKVRYGESRNEILSTIVWKEVSRLRADGVGLSEDEHRQLMSQDRTEASMNFVLPDDDSTIPFDIRNLDPESSDPYRKDLVSNLDMGLRMLVKTVMQDLRDEKSFFVEYTGNELVMRDLWKIFASTNRHVLKGIIQGDLCKSYHSEPQIKREIDEIRERARKVRQPVIYLGTVADRFGNPHTVGQIKRIFQVAKEYLQAEYYSSDHHLQRARDIDEGINSGAIFESYEGSESEEFSSDDLGSQDSQRFSQYRGDMDPLRQYRNGYRKMLSQSKKRPGFTRNRVCALNDSISAVDRRISASNQLPDDLFLPPFFDIGYSADFEERSKQHKGKTDRSHMILKLFLAISKLLYGRQYGLQQFVIYLIWEKAQASVGEKAFTYLANGMIKRGGGLTYCTPGVQVSSINDVSQSDWTKYKEFALKNSPYQRNDKLEMRRIALARKKVEAHGNLLSILRGAIRPLKEAEEEFRRTRSQTK